jgi:hypothetical protein
MQKENLEGMWSEALKTIAPAQELPVTFVYLTHRKIPGVCGHPYETEFVGNRHQSRAIKAYVKTTAVYMGQVVNESTKAIEVNFGAHNEIELGCTGFANDSGGYDTEYKRKILAAEWC